MNYRTANGRIEIAWPTVTLHNDYEPLEPITLDADRFRKACRTAFLNNTAPHYQEGHLEVFVKWGRVAVYDVLTGAIVRSDQVADIGDLATAIYNAACTAITDSGLEIGGAA